MIDSAHWLREQYVERKQRNPSYSLRAFARQVDLSSGALSEYLSGRRKLSPKMLNRIVQRLGVSPLEGEELIRGALEGNGNTDAAFTQLKEDEFQLIADWYHFAVLHLLNTEGATLNPGKLAARLGLSTVEVKVALERLQRLGLLQIKESRFRINKRVRTSTNVPSEAIRKFHRQSLEKTLRALDEEPVTRRDITSIIGAINPENLPKAKELILEFRRRLSTFLEHGKKTEVYQLNIQLIPLTKGRKHD